MTLFSYGSQRYKAPVRGCAVALELLYKPSHYPDGLCHNRSQESCLASPSDPPGSKLPPRFLPEPAQYPSDAFVLKSEVFALWLVSMGRRQQVQAACRQL